MANARTWEVPREEWAAYLILVEEVQRDTQVQVELVGPELGDQPLTTSARLRSIGATLKGSGAGQIELDLGVNGGLNHRVLHPAHVYATQAASGQIECLDIEEEDQTKTLIRFKEPRTPREVVATQNPGETLRVREYMTPAPHVLSVGSSLSRALALMQRHSIRHLPIVDSDGRLVGVLSDRELYLAKHERGIAPEDVAVEEVMATPPYNVSPDTRLEEAATVMAQRKYGSAVVVEGNRVVGVLTTTDVLRALVHLRTRGQDEAPRGAPPG